MGRAAAAEADCSQLVLAALRRHSAAAGREPQAAAPSGPRTHAAEGALSAPTTGGGGAPLAPALSALASSLVAILVSDPERSCFLHAAVRATQTTKRA